MVATLGRSRIEDELFDNTLGYDDETGVKVAKGLTPEEMKQAVTLYRLFNELWGVCVVFGDPGTGKDLFGNYLTYKLKRFFPHKRILRDEKPRELFGRYDGLFNEEVLHDDLARMKEIATGASAVKKAEILEKAVDDWVTSKGQVMLKNSVLYLTEYWDYVYRRRPMNPMNMVMGGLHKVKRHLDNFTIGTGQTVHDLDRFTSLPWIDWRVTCTRSMVNPSGFTYWVERVKYDRRMDVLVSISKPFPIAFDAGKPRSFIGDGKIVIRKTNYVPVTDEEELILGLLRAGIDTYEELVDVLYEEGDMIEDEVLHTLKELKFRKSKRAIGYNDYFSIYNSKSAPHLKADVKME